MKIKSPSLSELYVTDSRLRSAMAEMIRRIKQLNLNPSETAIIAIGRGGFVPAQYAAYALGITDLFGIQSILYDKDNDKKDVHAIGGLYHIPYEEFKNILVIDDLIDSGVSMNNIILTLNETAGELVGEVPEFIPCVIYTQKKKKYTKEKKIIFGRKIKKINGLKPWIHFPWDQDPT